ncbi:Riboflavin transporter MCH5 [Grifola frondosa]|uniref:Riboflavin transporter MCH5 n=1 Tax=Grifola frondosa TaxID=5627 RepID=A0A1C7LP93_GRIFR|nr:Riboflavin transporter MCH5 [Grifola frondosa]
MAESHKTSESISALSHHFKNDSLDPPDVPDVPQIIPPDGGSIAWMTIAGAWMVQFCTFGYINAFDYYTRDFLSTFSPSDISWIGSLQLFLMYAPGVFVGRAFDAGYFHYMEISGSILYIFSLFMLSLTQRDKYYQVFLAQGLGMGLGLGLTFLPSLSIVSHHFRRRRALAMGIVVSGASCGGIVFPIMLNRLFQSPAISFANGVRASAGLLGGLLVLANGLMRTRLPPKGRGAPLDWDAFARVVCDAPYLWSIAGGVLCAFCPRAALDGLAEPSSPASAYSFPLFAVDHGVDVRITTYCLAILNAGSTAGRLLPTFLADRLGVYNMLVPSIFTAGAVLFGMFGATTSAGVIVVGLIFGFASGAYVSLIPALLVMLCTDLSELGVRMGFAFSVVGAAMLTGTPISGALLGTGPLHWWRSIVFAGVCIVTGFACMLVSRTLFAARRGSQHI